MKGFLVFNGFLLLFCSHKLISNAVSFLLGNEFVHTPRSGRLLER